MNFEVLKRSHIKRNIIIAVIIILILSAVILTFTKAKYKTTASIPLVNGTINYELSDFNLIGAYIQNGDDYTPTNEIPSSGYEFNSEKSYCTVNGENINATINFDIETQTLSVVPLTQKGTKCYLYFDEKTSGSEYILASANAPTSHTTDWTGKESYYYTGNPDNWVSFAGFYWRIIRINGDGSIRMIYAGTNYSSTNDDTLGNSAFNSNPYNKTYVGLVYDGSTQHGYGTNSTVMNTLNDWYDSNLTNYEVEYIDTGTGFCNDRNMANGSNFNSSGTIYYAPYNRQNNGNLQCNTEDILSKDNGKLQNPIGLVTSDEAVLTGITYNTPNTGSYLYTGEYYWTMSPSHFSNDFAYVFRVNSDGYLSDIDLGGWGVIDAWGVRPVINIRTNVSLTGSGTTTDPFRLVL